MSVAAVGLAIVSTPRAVAATRAFTPVYTTNTTGDVMIRGNGLETCPVGSTSTGSNPPSCANVQDGTKTGVNNNFSMTYVDIDSDSATFNSSSATITIPPGATVLYAGLSWSATAGAGTLGTVTGSPAPTSSAKGVVSLKVPGSSTYSTVTSTLSPVDSTGSGYQGFAAVTGAVQAAGSGSYTVANVQAGTGGNDYAGWALAVAYRDPTQPIRNLAIYSGFTNVANGATTSIPITGFTTPLTGPVVTRLGTVVYEGDRGNVGDTMTLGANAISNGLNPVNDVQNSSITDLGVPITNRIPAYNNTLSTDIDRFDATGFLANGQTSTSITLKTVGDGYYPGLVTLATNLYSPSLQATKTVKDVTSGIISNVKVGDVLAYSMAITNVGGDGSTASILTDAVPTGTTYVAGSLVIGGSSVSDASGDDAGNVSSGTVTARLGTGATATAGGALATNASTSVSFNATINAGTVGGTVIANAAALGYTSATTGTTFTGTSNTVSSTVSAINVDPVLAFAAPPSGEVGATYSRTLTAAGGVGPYAWAVTTGTLPTGLTLNPTTGVISGTSSATGIYTFTVSATDANAQVATQTASIYVAPLPALNYPASVQTADTNNAYSYPLGVDPGTGPYVWSVSVGTLPAGLTLDPSTGVISGTPTVAGTRTFTVRVVDAFGAIVAKSTTLNVLVGPSLNNPAAPTGEISVAYSQDLNVVGGTSPFIWTTSSGTLPPGITLDSASGLLSGTPTATGTSNFTVTVTDVNGATASEATTIVIVPAPTLTGTLAGGEVTAPYSSGFTVNDGIGPFVWSISSGTLPAGLTLNTSTGLISGTPTGSSSTVTVQVADANGRTATRSGPINLVNGPGVTFTPPGGEVGVAYTAQPTATGGTGPYTWAVSSGTLPAGLSIDTSSGVITGTPTAAGSSIISVRATDAKGGSAISGVMITIVPAPTLSGVLDGGERSAPYSSRFTVSDGVGPFVWSISAGTLPAGLTLNTATGLISGTPTGNSAPITVQVSDANGRIATRDGIINLVDGPMVTFTPPTGEVGVAYTAQPTATGIGSLTWAVSAGTLPAGLSISPTTGAITGTPTAAGSPTITVRATDANGGTATQTATLTIVAAPTLTFAFPPSGRIGTAYSVQLTSSGGVGPYVWSVSAGTVPAGLTLGASTGLLSGTPTAAGSTSFTVKITDANGSTATRAVDFLVKRAATTLDLTGSAATGQFGVPVTLTATVGPLAATGVVTFTYVPTSGPDSGTTVTLGTGTVGNGVATLTRALPAFGLNTVGASYDGDSNYIAATSATVTVEASAYAGEVIVSEFRHSGPGGAGDNYVELLNTGPTVPLAGMKISADSGDVTTLPANAGLLGTGRSYLVAGAGFTLGAVATPDYSVATVGIGGMKVTAPDTAGTTTDAVGPSGGFHTGTGLAGITGNPDSDWAWVRTEVGGAQVDSRNNVSDFRLVSNLAAAVGGAVPMLGSASPTGRADPYQHNADLRSALLDPAAAVNVAPNRLVSVGTPGTLVIRRTIRNTSSSVVTAAKVRVTSLSEANGDAKAPGAVVTPARRANLRMVNPSQATTQITVGGTPTTVQNLSVDAPVSSSPGGGLNTTLTVPLPAGGLDPGASVSVAFTITFDTRGTFWFGYNVDAVGGTVVADRAGRVSKPTHQLSASNQKRLAAQDRHGSLVKEMLDSGKLR